jgi:hypothetical protein
MKIEPFKIVIYLKKLWNSKSKTKKKNIKRRNKK